MLYNSYIQYVKHVANTKTDYSVFTNVKVESTIKREFSVVQNT